MFPRLQSVSCHDGISVERILCFKKKKKVSGKLSEMLKI